jgi:hypothetical protein
MRRRPVTTLSPRLIDMKNAQQPEAIGLGLIGFYGFWAARFAGASRGRRSSRERWSC